MQASIDKRNAAVMQLEADYREAIAALRGLAKWCDSNINGVPREYGLLMAAADEAIAKFDKRP